MKANAPNKIYLESIYPDNGVLPNGLNYSPSSNDIEYIRTDAFIEKACEWLKENADMYEAFDSESKSYYMDKDKLVEDFKKLFKEE